MKILHMTPALTGGGIKTFVCQLSNAQAALGHDVHICTVYKPAEGAYAYMWLDKAVETHDLGKTAKGFSLKEVVDIYRFVRAAKPEVVNLHGFFYYYVLAIWLLHSKVRFVYTVHSDAHQENAHWDKKLLGLKRLFFRLGWLHAVSISKASQRSFKELYGCESSLIYNGVARPSKVSNKRLTSLYKKTEDTRIFIHVGRITEAKNQLVLCRVFERLIREGKDVVLLIIGQKQEEQIYESIQPFFSDKILYLGEQENAAQWMAEAEALCLPSLWEGMPITLLEALSVGCPTIATPVGGIPEVIQNGYNGYLAKEISEEAYYQAIVQYLAEGIGQRETMREHCIRSFEPFDIQNTAWGYINTYKQLLGR